MLEHHPEGDRDEAQASTLDRDAIVTCFDESLEAAGEWDLHAATDVEPEMILGVVRVGGTAEVDAAVSNLLSLLEPIMIVFLGVIVGGMVVAMYLPIFDMINAVQ